MNQGNIRIPAVSVTVTYIQLKLVLIEHSNIIDVMQISDVHYCIDDVAVVVDIISMILMKYRARDDANPTVATPALEKKSKTSSYDFRCVYRIVG